MAQLVTDTKHHKQWLNSLLIWTTTSNGSIRYWYGPLQAMAQFVTDM